MRRSICSGVLNGFVGLTLATAFLATTIAQAQTVTAYDEAGVLKRGSRTVSALGTNIAGERIDLYTGAVSIGQIDVSLPGNDDLTVAYGRRYNLSNHFFGWDPEIPRISGTFATGGLVTPIGWVVQGTTTAKQQLRCTNFAAPPGAMAKSGSGFWEADEFWSGHHLYVPGEVDELMLRRDAGNTIKPNAGTYPIVTKSHWQIGCTTLTLGSGEGFIAISPKGVTYVFDRMVSRVNGSVSNSTGSMLKQEIWILPSRVTDRFGNRVDYTYDTVDPSRVKSIVSTDGRRLDFVYQTSGSYTVSDGTRSWTYAANGNITLPDGTQWIYNLTKPAPPSSGAQPPHCENGAWINPAVYSQPITNTVTHPSGAQVAFSMEYVRRGVTGILASGNPCPGSGTYVFDQGPYPTFDTFALKTKTITGAGLPTMTWTFAFGPNNASWDCGSGCIPTNTLVVTDPKLNQVRYTFSNTYGQDGEIVQQDDGWNGSTALKTTANSYVTAGILAGNSLRSEQSVQENRVRQIQQRTITLQGTSFSFQATSFDNYGRTTAITRTGPSGTRAESTTYSDNLQVWVNRPGFCGGPLV